MSIDTEAEPYEDALYINTTRDPRYDKIRGLFV